MSAICTYIVIRCFWQKEVDLKTETPPNEVKVTICEAYLEILDISVEEILLDVLIEFFKGLITNAVEKLLADVACDTLKGLINDVDKIVIEASTYLLL